MNPTTGPCPWNLTYRYPLPKEATRPRPQDASDSRRRIGFKAAFAARWPRNEAGYRFLAEGGRD